MSDKIETVMVGDFTMCPVSAVRALEAEHEELLKAYCELGGESNKAIEVMKEVLEETGNRSLALYLSKPKNYGDDGVTLTQDEITDLIMGERVEDITDFVEPEEYLKEIQKK